jgi:hypothetical protein
VGSKELDVRDVLVRPGDGETITGRERRDVVVLKGVLPRLCFGEWTVDGPSTGRATP